MADAPVQEQVTVYDSILLSVKKWCGLPEDYLPFEDDVITCINTELNILNQVGVGVVGFQVSDSTSKWIDFLGSDETKFGIDTADYVFVEGCIVVRKTTPLFNRQ